MTVLVKNNAYSTLASGINSSVTTITLATGTGGRFPAAGGADYFYATLINVSNELEVVKVTARSTDTLTVVRGQDGTTARSYSTGDRVELRLTAALIEDIRDSIAPGDNTVTTAKIVDANVTTAKLADGNVTLAKLVAAVQQSLMPAGSMAPYVGTTAPTGWLLCSGLTIGSASSNATARANADTQTLYELLWNSIGSTELAIYTSAGMATTRGASASADFSANKALALPDLRGRVIAGQDDMGGTSANRLTGLSGGLDGDVLGATGGAQSHTLTVAEIPSHTHTINWLNQSPEGGSGDVASYLASTGSSSNTQATGGGDAHNNVQPTIVLNYIVKL